jgi:hypothetical protein
MRLIKKQKKPFFYFRRPLFIAFCAMAFLAFIIAPIVSVSPVSAQSTIKQCGIGEVLQPDNTCKKITDQQAPASDGCSSLKPSNNNDASANANYTACTEGYVAGYEGRKTQSQACPSREALSNTCIKGYQSGVADKAANRPSVVGAAVNNGGGSSGDAEEPQADCDVQLSSPISWIICPIIDAAANFSDLMFKQVISPLLEDVPVSTDPSDNAYKVWQQFRILANILLVGTLLVVVYAQIKGGR